MAENKEKDEELTEEELKKASGGTAVPASGQQLISDDKARDHDRTPAGNRPLG